MFYDITNKKIMTKFVFLVIMVNFSYTEVPTSAAPLTLALVHMVHIECHPVILGKVRAELAVLGDKL